MSPSNTARLLVDNPNLMRLRELEVLEKVAASSKLNVLLGEKGLADRGYGLELAKRKPLSRSTSIV